MSTNDPYYKSRPEKYEAHKEKMRIAAKKRYDETKAKLARLAELEAEAESKKASS